jgi:hypothetical protein
MKETITKTTLDNDGNILTTQVEIVERDDLISVIVTSPTADGGTVQSRRLVTQADFVELMEMLDGLKADDIKSRHGGGKKQ